uniref:Uncharacterized protein n=1 Tax=Oryza nivara TaxID=4536 RepID=A0A0E0GYQ8_ORYNI
MGMVDATHADGRRWLLILVAREIATDTVGEAIYQTQRYTKLIEGHSAIDAHRALPLSAPAALHFTQSELFLCQGRRLDLIQDESTSLLVSTARG